MPTLNPRAKGGNETVPNVTLLEKATEEELPAEQERPSKHSQRLASEEQQKQVPKGHGRIIRDAEGNIIDVQLGDDDEGEEDEEMVVILADVGAFVDVDEDDELGEGDGDEEGEGEGVK